MPRSYSSNPKEAKAQLQELLELPAWSLIVEKYQFLLAGWRKQLEEENLSHEESIKLRAKIAAMKIVLDAPVIIKGELSE